MRPVGLSMLRGEVHIAAGAAHGMLTLIVQMVSSILVYVETIRVVHEALRRRRLAASHPRQEGDSLMGARNGPVVSRDYCLHRRQRQARQYCLVRSGHDFPLQCSATSRGATSSASCRTKTCGSGRVYVKGVWQEACGDTGEGRSQRSQQDRPLA